MSSRSIPKWRADSSDGVPPSVQVIKPSSRNDHIILGSRQSVRTVCINDTNSGLSTIRSMKITTACTAIAFHPIADSVIASAGSNGEVSTLYYGAQNIAPLYDKWIAHSRAIHAMEFLPVIDSDPRDEVFLLTGSADGDINLWNLCSYFGKKESWRKPFLVCNIRSEGLRCGVRDLDSRRRLGDQNGYEILVGCDDGSIEYYESLIGDFPKFFLKFRLSISTQTINSVKFCPSNNRLFATGGKDSYIRIFDGETCVSSIRTSLPVWTIRWRPGGQYIAACHSVMDNGIYVWDLDSHLMPAYVFNSHADNVTDFFWADTNHIMSCSRDNTIQLHQIKHAIIPIERMRTVNISFSPKGSLTSVCDVINREKFEKDHTELRIEIAKKKGFPADIGRKNLSRSPSMEELSGYRLVVISNVERGIAPSPEDLIAAAPSLIRFISSVSKSATTVHEVSKLCEIFASEIDAINDGELTTTHADSMRFLAWLIADRPDTVSQIIHDFLTVFRRNNDLLIVLAISVICMFAPIPDVGNFITSEQFFRYSSSLIELFKKQNEWKLAAEYVYMSPVSDVRALSHVRTGINLTCTRCKRECDVGSDTCAKCKDRLNCCVLCGDNARGLWQSCPGCSHGGHPRHLEWWFSKYNSCPVPGCLHQCYC